MHWVIVNANDDSVASGICVSELCSSDMLLRSVSWAISVKQSCSVLQSHGKPI